MQLQNAIVLQHHFHFWMHQCHPREFFQHMLPFDVIAFQKIPSSRNIVKQILNRKLRSHRSRNGFVRLHSSTRNTYPRTTITAFLLRLQFNMCNSRDTGQRLTTKTLCCNMKQILRCLQFTCCMTLKAKQSIFMGHSFAIVLNVNQRFPSISDHHFYLGGSRINGVLQQLLHHRSGALHHLSCRNLIGNSIWKFKNHIAHDCIHFFNASSGEMVIFFNRKIW